ncbi:MAG: trigger factor [bacterium]
MEVKIEKLEKNLLKLEISIDAEAAAAEYSKACRSLSNNISIPGFRKGKAPRNMVEKHVGEDRIKNEALSKILPAVFANTITENDLDIATEPYVESYVFELGQDAKVVAKIELKPEITLKKYKGLTIDVEIPAKDEKAVDKEIENIAQRFTKLEDVTGRAATAKDVVFIDFDGSVNGEAIKGGSAKNYQLDLGNSNFIEGFADQIVGHNLGESFDIYVTFPDTYQEDNLKGKPAVFKIKINSLKSKKYPEIDDELAQKVGPFGSLDELKKDIQSYIDKQADMENKVKVQNAVLEKIIEQAEVEIPDGMVNKEAKILMDEFQQKITSQGMSWEKFLDSQGQEKIWEGLRDEATKRIKNSLVLSHIAKIEDVKVDDSEFESRISEMAKLYKTDERTIYSQISKNPMMVQSIMQQIISQSITDFLVENNKINYLTK